MNTIHLESHWEDGFKTRVAFCGVRGDKFPLPEPVSDDSSVVDCIVCLRKAYEHFRQIADHSTAQIAARSRKDRQLSDLPEREKPY